MDQSQHKIWVTQDSARFILLVICLLVYMIFGAIVFSFMENNYLDKNHFNGLSNLEFQRMLTIASAFVKSFGNETSVDTENIRLLEKKLRATEPKWDFNNSFYFVYSIISTIGYGNIVPRTLIGKITVIIYGYFGCSGGILFCNLFLERIISFFTWFLHWLHMHKTDKKFRAEINQTSRRESELCNIPWKPNVYWVLFFLVITTSIVVFLSSLLYIYLEDWSYLEALYFCFVSYSTIGFGDFVIEMNDISSYSTYLYKFLAFTTLVLGCSCTYSLFNVTSIVYKLGLNAIIDRLYKNKNIIGLGIKTEEKKKKIRSMHKRHSTNETLKKLSLKESNQENNDNESFDSELEQSDGRREYCSKKEYFSNKKELNESAEERRCETNTSFALNSGSVGAVGPLAILAEKLQKTY